MKSAAMEHLVEELAELFFKEVVAADAAWTDALAVSSDNPEQSQRVFYNGSPNEEEDLFDRYTRWVKENTRIPEKDQRVAISLADQVLFSVAKRVGSFEKVSQDLSASIKETGFVVAEALATAYGAHRIQNHRGQTTFYFGDRHSAQKFADDVSVAETVTTSSRVRCYTAT